MARTSLDEVKATSRYLTGEIDRELASDTDGFTGDSTQILKFHGIYQQDDRDVRRERQRLGLGKDLICMVRASIPGGVLDADQYLVADRLADEVGAGNLRVTTRQGLQWHFVRKGDLRPLVRTLNEHLVTTLAACGDVARNVMACPAPLPGRQHADVVQHARALARALRPRSSAYWDLWVDGERAASALATDPVGDLDDPEPLYGPTYLPRKFKVAFAHPGDDCVDALGNDVGIVPVLGDGRLEAFTVLVGGGLGMSHNNDATYPRLADPLTTVPPARLVPLVAAIVGVQRDHGDREDRKHARMKYLIADRGLEWFRAEVERRVGERLPPPRSIVWDRTDDHLGWQRQHDDRWFLGVPVLAGRIGDAPHAALRSGLRRVVDRLRPGVRFTPRQDVLLTGIHADDRDEVTSILRDHGVALVEDLPPVVRTALACPALPTCGLALTEAERVLPEVAGALTTMLASAGLGRESFHVRMTGCPNGCARPYTTEVGIVGRGKDHYSVFLGGDPAGTRLNRPFADRVARDDLVALLAPVVAAWRDERDPGEGFGDWCHRAGVEHLRERFGDAPRSAASGAPVAVGRSG